MAKDLTSNKLGAWIPWKHMLVTIIVLAMAFSTLLVELEYTNTNMVINLYDKAPYHYIVQVDCSSCNPATCTESCSISQIVVYPEINSISIISTIHIFKTANLSIGQKRVITNNPLFVEAYLIEGLNKTIAIVGNNSRRAGNILIVNNTVGINNATINCDKIIITGEWRFRKVLESMEKDLDKVIREKLGNYVLFNDENLVEPLYKHMYLDQINIYDLRKASSNNPGQGGLGILCCNTYRG